MPKDEKLVQTEQALDTKAALQILGASVLLVAQMETQVREAQLQAALMDERVTKALLFAAEKEAQANLERTKASIDPLTGFLRKDRFMEVCGDPKVSQSRVNRRAAINSMLFLDIDNFKTVNDTYGHPAGDEVLVEFAARIRSNVREDDIVGRWGGDEFMVFLPETNEKGALRVAEKLLLSVNNAPLTGLDITISIGAAEIPDGDLQLAEKRADAAAYAAKDSGKNQAVGFSFIEGTA